MTTMSKLPIVGHWIDGTWLETGHPEDSVDPATGVVFGRHFVAGPAQAQQAIDAARRAFLEETWREDRNLRARVLNRMADVFEAHTDELVDLLARENGKVTAHGHLEVDIVPACFRFNAALALTEYGRVASPAPGSLSMVVRQPAGVAGIIAPWNSPVALVIRSLAPALAAGCTAAVMLPRQTAHVNALIARLISETDGLPRGVVNIFTGGQEAGSVLVTSPDVPVVSFTGSTATGRTISANAAPRLKRLGLELGGKTPMVVFDDADIDAAASMIVTALTVFAGQFCMTGSRVLVQRGVADRLIRALARALEAVKVGPASDPASEMGPLIDKPNVERVDKMVKDAIAAGAKVILRGGPATEPSLAGGAFYRPTLLEVTSSKLEIVQKEVFGPVLTLQRFDDEAEAIRLANDSDYGLCASVWSRDADRPLRVALALESGTVWLNTWARLADQFEEGGFKQSGQGRMRGVAVLDDFLEYKHIALQSAH
jgi:betaine-aldehyde dehydrogenase